MRDSVTRRLAHEPFGGRPPRWWSGCAATAARGAHTCGGRTRPERTGQPQWFVLLRPACISQQAAAAVPRVTGTEFGSLTDGAGLGAGVRLWPPARTLIVPSSAMVMRVSGHTGSSNVARATPEESTIEDPCPTHSVSEMWPSLSLRICQPLRTATRAVRSEPAMSTVDDSLDRLTASSTGVARSSTPQPATSTSVASRRTATLTALAAGSRPWPSSRSTGRRTHPSSEPVSRAWPRRAPTRPHRPRRPCHWAAIPGSGPWARTPGSEPGRQSGRRTAR